MKAETEKLLEEMARAHGMRLYGNVSDFKPNETGLAAIQAALQVFVEKVAIDRPFSWGDGKDACNLLVELSGVEPKDHTGKVVLERKPTP